LQADFFPSIFGPNQDQPLDTETVRDRFRALADRTGGGRSPEEVAEGFLKIAVENMANAIKKISVQRGYDVTRSLLNSFGGAGGQHACLVADALGMESILIHPFSGLLSAYGIGLATVTASRQQGLMQPLAEHSRNAIAALERDLSAMVEGELAEQGLARTSLANRTKLHLRYAGTDTTLDVPFSGDMVAARTTFEAMHKAQFGFITPDKEITV